MSHSPYYSPLLFAPRNVVRYHTMLSTLLPSVDPLIEASNWSSITACRVSGQAYRVVSTALMSPTSKRRRLQQLNIIGGSAEQHAGNVELRSGAIGGSVMGDMLKRDISSSLKTTEAEIFGIMLEAVNLSESGTVVRVAGGWVRDKLLGLENEDIDIALDNCTGVAFAEMVNSYLKTQGKEEGKIAVIEANPEQSKHLETARMKVMEIWIDLVNLRTEVYRADSRIPDASLGTPEEDALRRDFTLNALFYNVNERKVEDKTGRGVDDLRDGIIRTPLPPMTTFKDDPLRVLRAVRFAARFGFTLHEDLRTAAQDKAIQAALGTKVSRERVGTELSGMITGKMAQPGLALSLLQELGLAPSVYAPPKHLVPPAPEGGFDWARGAAVARAAARLLALRSNVAEVGQSSTQTPGETAHCGGSSTGGKKNEVPPTLVRELFLCAALLPLTGVKHQAKKGKLVSASQSVVSDSLKLKAKEAKNVGDILDLWQTFRSLADANLTNLTVRGDVNAAAAKVDDVARADGAECSRLAFGLALRQARELWPTCVDLCCAMEMCDIQQQMPTPSSSPRTGTNAAGATGDGDVQETLGCGASIGSAGIVQQIDSDEGVNMDTAGRKAREERSVIAKYAEFRKAVASFGLERAWDLAPLLRGNELMAELKLSKGPEIGKQMAKQISWQLEHPEGTREQCLAFLRETPQVEHGA